MRTRFALAALVVAAATALPAFTATGKEDHGLPRKLSVPVVLTGAHSKVQKRAYMIARNQDELVRIWRKHLGRDPHGAYSMHYNPLEVPAVDFSHFQVVAVFQGQAVNSAGLKVMSLTEEKGMVLLRFDDKSYQTMNAVDGVRPFGFFLLPKAAKKVVLMENVQGTIGAPPVWKKRIVFGQAAGSTTHR